MLTVKYNMLAFILSFNEEEMLTSDKFPKFNPIDLLVKSAIELPSFLGVTWKTMSVSLGV